VFRRFRRFRRFGLALLALGLAGAGAFGVSSGLASGGAPVSTLQGELKQCQKNLAQAKDALDTADSLAILTAKRQIFFYRSNGKTGYILVDAAKYRKFLILQYVTGNISGPLLAAQLVQLGKNVAAASSLTTTLVDEATAERDKLENQCAQLAMQLKQAQQGGQQGSTGGSGGTGRPAALELTITLKGAEQTRNLTTNAVSPPNGSPGATLHLTSGPSYPGMVTVTGTLPAGYTVYVFYDSKIIAVLPPTGGPFSVQESASFGAATVVEAHACKEGGMKGGLLPPNCKAEGADIGIYWTPG